MPKINDYKDAEVAITVPKSVFSNIKMNSKNYEDIKLEHYKIYEILNTQKNIKSSTMQNILSKFNLKFKKCSVDERKEHQRKYKTYNVKYKIYNDEMYVAGESIIKLLISFRYSLRILIDRYEDKIISILNDEYSKIQLQKYRWRLLKIIDATSEDINK